MVIRQHAAWTEQVAYQCTAGGKCRRTPLRTAIDDAVSHIRREGECHRRRGEAALANSRFTYQGNRTASAVPPWHSLTKCCKFVEPIHDPILITARHLVMVDIGRLSTEPVDPDDAISD